MHALALAGPTACGKSDFAMHIAAAGGEIISADSGAVYQKMDIGTAKPNAAARAQIPHHLIDVRAPDENFNAGIFCRLSTAAAADILARGKIPLLAGGTMMYFYALQNGMHRLPEIDAATRATVREDMQKQGARAMHNRLAKLDPEAAQKIAPNDSHRIARGLEIVAAAGRPFSAWAAEEKPPPPLRLSFIFLVPESREMLRARIGARLDGMFARGLVEETRAVMEEFNLRADSPPMRLAGYRQAAAHLGGAYNAAEAQKRAYYATCQLAKRQMTWLRNWRGAAQKIDPFANGAAKKILAAAQKLQRTGGG